jgi:hypothetical protein
MNNTLFAVREEPAVWLDKDRDANIHRTSHKFIVRNDTNEIISCMTEKYQLVRNSDVYSMTKDVMHSSGGTLTEQNVYGNGARTMWKWSFPKIRVEIATNDVVSPEIIITNSYDGSSEVGAIAGAFRFVCTNGMIIGHKIGQSGIRHNIWADVEAFYSIVQEMINRTEEVFTSDFKRLIDTPINQSHIGDLIEMFPMQTMQALTSYMVSHPVKNYWDLMNAATWITSHKMDRNKEATRKLEKKIFPKISGMVASA